MAEPLYRIEHHDDHSITLIHPVSRRTVHIARGQIASVHTGWGEISLTTTGGVSYRITRGIMPKQRAAVRAARR